MGPGRKVESPEEVVESTIQGRETDGVSPSATEQVVDG